MTILGAEVSLYPPTLFAEQDALAVSGPAVEAAPREDDDISSGDLVSSNDLPASDRTWWVLHTKARQEKAVARDLLVRRIPFYLPLIEQTAVRRKRRVTSLIPLFQGYVFMFGTLEERLGSLKTNRLAQVLEVHEPQQLRGDLARLQRLIASHCPLTLESRLAPGAQVRITTGSLMGLEGIVLHRRGHTRLLVDVRFMQQGASIEIDDFMLEPIT